MKIYIYRVHTSEVTIGNVKTADERARTKSYISYFVVGTIFIIYGRYFYVYVQEN